MFDYQRTKTTEIIESHVANGAYNVHIHNSGCFKSSDKKRTNNETGGSDKRDECRYRLPKRQCARTQVQNATEKPIKWYLWNGICTERHIHEVLIKRHSLDAFQNESCEILSKSKLCGNNNVSIITPGPLAGYIFKYQTKDTQVDDTAQYERVSDMTMKILERRKHESESKEAVRRILAATFAHQKKGIIGSAMASYLTRNESRFRMSHVTAWIPLRDTYRLIIGSSVSTTVNQTGDSCYFVNSALHYLCRPKELESLCMSDFYTKFEVVSATKKNRKNLLEFVNTPHFMHPSYQPSKDNFRQGIKERNYYENVIAKVFQKDFPDAATFGGNILEESNIVTERMEEYSRSVMMLFTPFRSLADLVSENSFTKKFRKICAENKLTEHSKITLQNIQNTAYNGWRVKNLQDDLQRNTVLLGKHDFDIDLFPELEFEEGSNVKEADFSEVEQILKALESDTTEDNESTTVSNYTTNKIPKYLDGKLVKEKGTFNSGYEGLSKRLIPLDNNDRDLISVEEDIINQSTQQTGPSNGINIRTPPGDLVASLLLHKRTRLTRSFQEITGNDSRRTVLQANGSAQSIIDWANKAGLDRYQKRAFEIMASTFVLTYHRIQDLQDMSLINKNRLRRETISLFKLSDADRRRNKRQLVGLMHGPGGSGKSTCIDLLLAYAKEFCSLLGPNYSFTSQTIVVTALTGVAASLLNGETVHSRLYLCQKKAITPERIETWEETRMVIIDEISFCDRKTMNSINSTLCRLRQNERIPFGGLSIVFSGDFRQLEPPSKSKALYEDICPAFQYKINCFMELQGQHRFKDDPMFGEILTRMRNGTITKEDIDWINTRVVKCKDNELPPNLRYATYYNSDRDAINSALFEQRCRDTINRFGDAKDCLLIFSDDIRMRTSPKIYKKLRNRGHFWNNCTESNIKTKVPNDTKIDPVLKLYKGCSVMLPTNIDVKNGQANGTRASIKRIVLKRNNVASTVNYEGMMIPAVSASQVAYVELEHDKQHETGATFRIKPQVNRFQAEVLLPELLRTQSDERERVRMTANQIPILISNATTGHKLQGSTVSQLFVHSWRYETNWPYVVLSRVKTLSGLFLRQPLKYDKTKFEIPKGLKNF